MLRKYNYIAVSSDIIFCFIKLELQKKKVNV